MNSVLVKNYSEPKVNIKEILRYSCCDEGLLEMVEECLRECHQSLSYKVCYLKTDIKVEEEYTKFPFGIFKSSSLAKNLKGCKEAIIFGATIGIGLDRFISKYGQLSPAKGVIFQGIGAERIEALCDEFMEDIAKENNIAFSPRFSPGYGDLSIEVQKDLFKILNCPGKIGLTLLESYLMSPSKSVTAIAGIID